MLLRLFILCFALAAGGGAAWLATSMNAQQELAEAQQQEVPTRDVLVAVAPISGGEVLTPDRVRWQPWPEPNLNDEYIVREEQP